MKRFVLGVILITFLLVLSGSVLAENFKLESVEFKSGGFEVTHILPQNAQVVDIVVNVTANDSLISFKADLTDINPNPAKFLANQDKIFNELTDSTSTFHQEKVFFFIGDGNPQFVTDGNTILCEGIFTEARCSAGERLSATIKSAQGVASSDDAGNVVEGNLQKSFICDQFAPGDRLIEGEDESVIFNLTHSSGALFENPKSGDKIKNATWSNY